MDDKMLENITNWNNDLTEAHLQLTKICIKYNLEDELGDSLKQLFSVIESTDIFILEHLKNKGA